MDELNAVLKLVGGVVVAGGGLSYIVFQTFKRLGAKWLDARFEERLQALKHTQQKELEQLRYKISALLDRTVKLHQREFDVLPEAWSKLNDAYWRVRSLVSPVQSYPDVGKMPVAQQEQFIADCKLEEWQKVELRQAVDKTKYYQTEIFWARLAEAKEDLRIAYEYHIKNGIFIREDLRQKFSTVHDLLWHALTEHETNRRYDMIPRKSEEVSKLNSTSDDFMKILEREIHQRLWPAAGEQ